MSMVSCIFDSHCMLFATFRLVACKCNQHWFCDTTNDTAVTIYERQLKKSPIETYVSAA